MRLVPLMSSALVLALSGTSFAQEWADFAAREDRFAVNFPGQPKITTPRGPRRSASSCRGVYSGTSGAGRYSVTVVDYNPMERILSEKSRFCPPGAETCAGSMTGVLDTGKLICEARSSMPRRSAATRRQDTNMMANTRILVAGQDCSSPTRRSIPHLRVNLHAREQARDPGGDRPQGYPPPTIFQQSLGWLDERACEVAINHHYRAGRAEAAYAAGERSVPARRCHGLAGDASRSPALHNYLFAHHGLAGTYVPLAIKPDDSRVGAAGIGAARLSGCNLTIPHKERALAIVDTVDPVARRIGAISCVVVRPDGSLAGTNNDGYGFVHKLLQHQPEWRADAGPIAVIGAEAEHAPLSAACRCAARGARFA